MTRPRPVTASSIRSDTMPSTTATTGVPRAAKMSRPSWRWGNGQGRNACQSFDQLAGPATGNGPATWRKARRTVTCRRTETLVSTRSTAEVLSAPLIPGGSGKTYGGGGGIGTRATAAGWFPPHAAPGLAVAAVRGPRPTCDFPAPEGGCELPATGSGDKTAGAGGAGNGTRGGD